MLQSAAMNTMPGLTTNTHDEEKENNMIVHTITVAVGTIQIAASTNVLAQCEDSMPLCHNITVLAAQVMATGTINTYPLPARSHAAHGAAPTVGPSIRRC